jgi:Kef-type K+ transport system membrane component KefB
LNPELSFTGLVIVGLVAFIAPLIPALMPRLRIPAVVLEIVAGIVVGPSVLGWVEVDTVIQVLAIMGLAMLLMLAGMEIELERLVGPFLAPALTGLAVSAALGLGAGFLFHAAGFTRSALLIGIALLATSLGLVIPVLKDAGESASDFGQLTIAGAALADFAAIILLSLFFSQEDTDTSARLVLLGAFALLVVVFAVAIAGAGRFKPISRLLLRLQDTTAQIRVRGAMVLMIGFVALAEALGLEVILGAFIAGAVLKLIDKDVMTTHPHFPLKLDAIGFGFLIPVFFVTSGLNFDLDALLNSSGALLRVPLFLLALICVRGLPALVYRKHLSPRQTFAAALLQATSLPFLVATSMIALELGTISSATAAALIAAGLLSVLIFPALALGILKSKQEQEAA